MNRSTAAACVAAMFLWNVAQAQVGNNDAILNPNVAGEDQLRSVTHLDPELVGSIVDSRPFSGRRNWMPC